MIERPTPQPAGVEHGRVRGRLERVPAPLRPLATRLARAAGRFLGGVARLRPARLRATLDWARQVLAASRRRRSETRLTVAVDADPLWDSLTGVGWYLHRLLAVLAQRDDVVLRLYGPPFAAPEPGPPPRAALPEGPAIEVVRCSVPRDLSVPTQWLCLGLRLLAPWLVRADGNRVVYGPNFILPRRLRRVRAPLAVVVHDLAMERYPWTLKEETRAALARHFERTLERAAAVICPSEAVRDEVVARRGVARARTHAIHHGPGHLTDLAALGEAPHQSSRSELEMPDSYALFVGTLEPRKNLGTLLAAFGRLRAVASAGMPEPPVLVLCGARGWKTEELEAALAAGERDGWLRVLGYVPDADLARSYRGARLVVCPSLYEGFGLPLVEAMWAGVPLVCSDIPVFREVGRDAALYVEPEDVAAWCEALQRVWQSAEVRRRLIEAGQERVQAFDWTVAGERTLEVWQELARERQKRR